MTDLVVISLEVWDEVWRRNQHLVAGLLRGGHIDRVLFVEPSVDVPHDLRRRRRPAARGLRQVDLDGQLDRLWALRLAKWLPRRLAPRGDRERARGVAAAARSLGLVDPVLWVNDPAGVETLELTRWPALYDITDDWLLADRTGRELGRLEAQERRLLAESARVVVCSSALARSKSRTRPVVHIPNAVDLEPYRSRAARPFDLPPGLVALYVGTIHRDRIDVALCVRTARRLAERAPAGQLVLLGPALLPQDDLDQLLAAGVRILGPRPSQSVPAYLQHADVLLVPHVLTEFTLSLDPIKAYEYRAAGRPVVATPVPGFADTGDARVVVHEGEAFVEAVSASMDRSREWSTAGLSEVPSWDQRVTHMAEVIRDVHRSQR